MDGFLIWLIIMVIVVVAKGMEKLKAAAAASGSQDQDRRVDAAQGKRSPPHRRPAQPPPISAMPPPVSKVPPQPRAAPDVRDVGDDALRRFLADMNRPLPSDLPSPAVMPEPLQRASSHVERPQQTVEPPPPQAKHPVMEPLRISRAAKWVVALRDRDNLRNAVVASEILGRPRGLADL